MHHLNPKQLLDCEIAQYDECMQSHHSPMYQQPTYQTKYNCLCDYIHLRLAVMCPQNYSYRLPDSHIHRKNNSSRYYNCLPTNSSSQLWISSLWKNHSICHHHNNSEPKLPYRFQPLELSITLLFLCS